MLLTAGVTLSDGISMLLDDEAEKDGQEVLRSLTKVLDENEPLSAALRESGYFPRYMVNMTEAGEKTGRLSETMKELSAHYDRQERLALSIRNAILYPSILLVMMVVVVLVLIIKVLPIFNDVFNRLGSQMSPLAVRLMQFGGWLRNVSAILAAFTALIAAVAFLAWLIPPIRGVIVTEAKNIWGHRGVFGRIASSRFTSVMSQAVASGLDTESTIALASAVSGGSKSMDEKFAKCLDLLQSGETLADALYGARLISARDLRMLSLGNRSGMIDAAMSEIVNRNDRAVQDEIDRLVSKIEPVIVVITSVMVGVILLSVMIPLMSIMTSIG